MVRIISTRSLGQTLGEDLYDRGLDGPAYEAPPLVFRPKTKPKPSPRPFPVEPVELGEDCDQDLDLGEELED